MSQTPWEGKRFSYFQNRECEYFPCHAGADPKNFNCLFCYCPLYALGDACGGEYTLLENGIKDCSGCLFPHKREEYGHVLAMMTGAAYGDNSDFRKENDHE